MLNCSNISNNSTVHENIKVFQQIVNIPVFCFGVIFNGFAFWVFCFKLEKWTETRVYMINLVIADSSLVFTLPFMMHFQLNDYPVDNLCLAIDAIFFTNFPMSIYIITLIAVDRYIAIKHPLNATTLRSPLKSATVCVFLWITTATYAYLNPQFTTEKLCFKRSSLEPHYRTVFLSTVVFFIPLGILSFCSIQVIRCLKEKTNATPREEKLTQKAVYIVFVNLSVFIICFLPVNVGVLLSFAMQVCKAACSTQEKVTIFMKVATGIAQSNCCLDAICYYFVGQEFKEASSLSLYFKSLQCRANQRQETEKHNR